VQLLARALREAGHRPGIVSRGYGRRRGAPEPMAVHPDTPAADSGDEPLLLRRLCGCPVWVGRDRPAAARALLRAHPEVDVLLSDDGLQHYALARDLELVVLDARGAGNGWPLPAGPLRESWGRRRDATLGPPLPADSGAAASAPYFALRRHPGELRNLADGRRLSLQEFQLAQAGSPVCAAAAIGNPGQFFDMLRDAGLTLARTASARDHRALPEALLRELPGAVVLTEKDALKCRLGQPGLERLWAVGLRVEPDPAFLPWLLARLARGAWSPPMDSRLLDLLVCPVCKGPLQYEREAQELICPRDRLAFPVRDGIAVMLVEQARDTQASAGAQPAPDADART
jgi:tetraacyldisaccharide 4'-kinase